MLGFDDSWFMIIGIFILSVLTTYLFNSSVFNCSFFVGVFSWGISLFFTVCNWLFMRMVLIQLRVKFPSFKESIKRITMLFFILVASVLLIDFFGNLVLSLVYGKEYHPTERPRIIIPVIIISMMIQAIYEAIYHYVRLKKAIRDEEQAKQLVVQAQLDALRNQAQPHFLFNTLNTLRDIIDQNTKEEAKDFVDKIADVYRFILESGNADLIRLKDELKFAHSYIHIQKERFGDNLHIQIDLKDDVLDCFIVPMSLQLLLENAIKHNVISRSKPLKIKVTAAGDSLIVENKIQPKSSKIASTKVGLKNINRRYKLLTEKSIVVWDDGKMFAVEVPLISTQKED